MATVPSENKKFNAKNGLSVGSPPINVVTDQGYVVAPTINVALTNTSANASFFIPFASGNSTGNYALGVSGLSYNPAFGILSVSSITAQAINPNIIDFSDGSSVTEHLRFGGSDDAKFFYNGTANTMNLELEAAATGFIITDNGTTKFTFEKTTGNLEIDGGIKQKQITYDVVATGGQSIDFATSSNFLINLNIGTDLTFTNLASSIGASGYIFIKQNGIGGHQFTLPVEAKTPGGRTIVQVTTANSLSLITYYIVDNQNVIVNYISDFK